MCIKVPINFNQSIKGHNSAANLRKVTGSNPNLDFVNINMHIQNLAKFYRFVLKILSGNEILNEIVTSVKGHNSFTNLVFVSINAYTKLG